MSYLDQMQNLWWDKDDFFGDSIDDRWTVSGSATVVDAQNGGVIRLTTGATTNDSAFIYWGDIRSLLVSNKLTIEIKAKLSTLSNINLQLGVRYDNINKIYHIFDTSIDVDEWYIYTRDGVGASQQNTSTLADTDYHLFRIECFPAGEVHFYQDGVETTNSPLTTNIPTNYLQPWVFLQTKEDAVKTADVDYVAWRQNII